MRMLLKGFIDYIDCIGLLRFVKVILGHSTDRVKLQVAVAILVALTNYLKPN